MSYPGVLHQYASNLTAFEFSYGKPNPKVVLFIAGMCDGLLSVPYVPQLAEKLTSKGWSLVQIVISSSHLGFGVSSLAKDAKEISQLVKYLRSDRGGNRSHVVLMGHLTGCQDTLQFLAKKSYETGFDAPVDGGILQAPVSDYEGLNADKFKELTQEVYDEYIAKGKQNDILPEKFRKLVFGVPINAYRFYSLCHARGDDDFFSSYLNQQDHAETFGKVKQPLLVLFGSKDEFVPDRVDKVKLISSWKDATDPNYWSPLSRILAGANHKIDSNADEGTREDLIETVLQFISTI